ncbi:hypothetical protein [Laspinema olomoucense]|uniref:Uncharacterized protein n=1 Tax=Laspinema olomoucense D3b TaxID=2953688 RepID=A0ABT2N203_9CYAN|nr:MULTISPECIES: hypothetical protein [unclassified Laspinema]MCT7972873.1 hypothetical protein [Laspinema sp. D3d]MCT7976713.1 hypothetical protein [Laspinema sp. D3b]MCT7991185.1 hypothetical protein [Laspinema sp. D3a]MCT7995589.1 hypothetical protein [Laspinema sp. D3c]
MLEMLLLDIFVILGVLWFIADPTKPKPVMRRPKKVRAVQGNPEVLPRTVDAEPKEMTAELIPQLSEWRSPELANPHPESTGSELATPSVPRLEKQSVRNQSKQVNTQPRSSEAQWGSVSTK